MGKKIKSCVLELTAILPISLMYIYAPRHQKVGSSDSEPLYDLADNNYDNISLHMFNVQENGIF